MISHMLIKKKVIIKNVSRSRNNNIINTSRENEINEKLYWKLSHHLLYLYVCIVTEAL